jgi:DnaJ-class molecular chaperone with C-terminal Zn finger domain
VPVTVLRRFRARKVEIPTLNGPIQLKIPPGTSSGQKMRLKGKGLTKKGKTGDLYVRPMIVVPKSAPEPGEDGEAPAQKASELLRPLYAGDVRAALSRAFSQ